MALKAGDKLGPYEIVSPIGRGGMGEVWKARDPRLNRDVAIKVSAQQFTDRFEREARAIAALNHKNICTLYDIGPNYLVMEFVEGPTLAERIAQGPIPLEEALGIAKQIADALEAAHEKPIIHRDLKPANIKIKPDGTVKVLDFGLAKSAEYAELTPDSPTMLTVAGMILGTAGYMSPEQARGKDVDKRADIWAFGVVFYEMLTGKRLFEGETVSDTLAEVIKEEPDLTKVPAKVRRLLRACLQKDLRYRLQAIGDSRLLLEDVESATAAPSRSRFGVAGWAVGTVLGVSLAILAAFHFREKPVAALPLRTSILPPDNTAFDFFTNNGPAAVSPDGRRLVFTGTSADGKRQLWVRPLDALTAQPLAGTEGAWFPFWSPDSRSIGFFAPAVEGQTGNRKLKKIDAAGGPAITLADAPNPRGASWGSQGVIVFAPGNGVNQRLLYQISESGGNLTPIGKGEGEENLRFPWFLPDGRHFIYEASKAALGNDVSIRLGALDSEPSKLLVPADSNAIYSQGHLLFLRDRTLMAQPFDLQRLATAGEAIPIAEQVQDLFTSGRFGMFSASINGPLVYQQGEAGGNQRLTWFNRDGKPAGILDQARYFLSTNFSPDGKRLAASKEGASSVSNIWLYDLARGLPTRFSFGSAVDGHPTWSPDGRTIIFGSNRKGRINLYRKSVDGTGDEELLYEDQRDKEPWSCSPDGKILLYVAGVLGDPRTKPEIWVLPLTDKPKPYLWHQTASRENTPQFSPDGRWVAYVSGESGRTEVYATPFPGPGGKHQISSDGGVLPRWQQDGKGIYFVTPDRTLTAAEVTVKGDSLEVGQIVPLFGPIDTTQGRTYDVSVDGKRFLVATNPERKASQPLTVVQNWTAGLKK